MYTWVEDNVVSVVGGERWDTHLGATPLETVVVRLLAVMRTVLEPFHAIVAGRAAEEAVRERLVALLVPLEVTNHFLLLHEHAEVARECVAVKVFPVSQLLAQFVAAFRRVGVSAKGGHHSESSWRTMFIPFDEASIIDGAVSVDHFGCNGNGE